MAQLKTLTTLACWVLFISGCICIAFGITYRFTQFGEFKLWIGSMALGIFALILSGVIAFLRYKLD